MDNYIRAYEVPWWIHDIGKKKITKIWCHGLSGLNWTDRNIFLAISLQPKQLCRIEEETTGKLTIKTIRIFQGSSYLSVIP